MPISSQSPERVSGFIYMMAIISVVLLITGMFFSRAMMSIGMITAGLLFFNPLQIKNNFSRFLKSRELLCLSAIFLVYLLSGIYSEDQATLAERLTIKLPFLIMPLGFAAFPYFNTRHFNNLLYYFLILTSAASIWSLAQYIANYQEITASYLSAKVIPTLVNHIRFSLMTAFAIFAGYYLIAQKHYFISIKEKYFIATLTLILFVFLHILSVRSGLLAFYATAATLLFIHTLKSDKKTESIAILSALFILPIAAYFLSPTLKNKISYSIEDTSRFFNNEDVNDYSDGNRLLSWKIGIEVGNTNPLIGAGVGDVKNLSFDIYKNRYPEIEADNHLIPHNQFIFVYAAGGLLGVLIFSFATFYPLAINYSKFLFAAINIVFISSYISEATVETQLGTCIYLTFFLLTWNYYKGKEPKKEVEGTAEKAQVA
ncbi:O-antigen ligase family protein [Cytophagaceae bacterium ABcell3]|nr:O-antigen ligase family protein [Cytophagaceae bacterium ABcell3]